MKIVLNMPEDAYHGTPAVSQSLLKQIARSEAHGKAWLDGIREEPTPAMMLGRAIHAAILEPARFADRYVVIEGDRRTAVVKAQLAAAQEAGQMVLRPDEYETCIGMAGACREHATVAALLGNGGNAEVSVFWDDDGLPCKARADWVSADGATLVDIKSTDDASPAAFTRAIYRYGYAMQDAHYRIGFRAEDMVFVAVEKEPPHAIGVYRIAPEWRGMATERRSVLMAKWMSAVEFGRYPAYPLEIVNLEAPAWADE
mgnify:CR=1 FL=1